MDWLDLLAVQGTLKSLLQHRSSKVSILQHSAFSMVELSHPYMTTGKTIALTRRTFVGKVMSLLFNVLSRLVITLLLRSKRLLISWLRSPFAVILEPKKIKSVCFHCFPIYLPWSDGTRCLDLHFFECSLVVHTVKNLSVMQKTHIWSLGWEDPLEKGVATHSSILAWRIPWTEEPGGLSPWGRKELDTAERLTLFMYIYMYIHTHINPTTKHTCRISE